jgi:predicted metal-dependent enzyme (double-stranded beta helix superfamily)
VFDVDILVADCQNAMSDVDPRGAVREVLLRRLERPGDVADVLGKNEAGISVLFNSSELTVLNFIWAPHMSIYPHDHRIWAAIGIYGGAESNTIYRRGPERIAAAGERVLDTGDVFGLGADAIHSVYNPRAQFTGAIHVYGGDFINQPRSQWDPDTLTEQPYDLEEVRQLFAAANDEWRAQLGHDLDEQTV